MSRDSKYQCNKCGAVEIVKPNQANAWPELAITGGNWNVSTVDVHLCRPCVRLLADFIPSIKPDLERFFDYTAVLEFKGSVPVAPEKRVRVCHPVVGLRFQTSQIVIDDPSKWSVHDLLIGGRSQMPRKLWDVGTPAKRFMEMILDGEIPIEAANQELEVRVDLVYVGDTPGGEPISMRVIGTMSGFRPEDLAA